MTTTTDVRNFQRNARTVCQRRRGEVCRLAKRAGISRVYLSQIIHGHARPSLAIAAKIARAADVPLAALMGSPKDFSCEPLDAV